MARINSPRPARPIRNPRRPPPRCFKCPPIFSALTLCVLVVLAAMLPSVLAADRKSRESRKAGHHRSKATGNRLSKRGAVEKPVLPPTLPVDRSYEKNDAKDYVDDEKAAEGVAESMQQIKTTAAPLSVKNKPLAPAPVLETDLEAEEKTAQVQEQEPESAEEAAAEEEEPTPEPESTTTTDCSPGCNAHSRCENAKCVCKLGHGGNDCGFSMKDIYYTNSVYEGFKDDPAAFRPLDLTGWSPPASVYEEILDSVDAVTVIEVGVWKGLSSSHMANWLKRKNRGVLICIDTFLGAPEFWGKKPMTGEDSSRGLNLKFGWPTVFYSFLSNIVHQQLEQVVVPMPLPSMQAATVLRRKAIQADVVHIDASHEYGAVKSDIHLWWPFVKPGGILIGDDYDEYWFGVIKAVKEFALMCDLEVKISANVKWWIKKPAEPLAPGLPEYCYRIDETAYYGEADDMDDDAPAAPAVPAEGAVPAVPAEEVTAEE